MDNTHGDRKSPRPGVVGPLPNGRFMTFKWGILTAYQLLTEIILQSKYDLQMEFNPYELPYANLFQ